jgi:uncharacterized protein YybS (DUF2232 family)
MAQKLLSVLGAVVATAGLQLLVLRLISQEQSSFLVIAGSGLAFLVPWPVAILVLRQGYRAAMAALFASGLLLGAAGSWPLAVAYLVQFGLGSVIVPHLLMKGWNWGAAVLTGTGLSVGGGIFALSAFSLQQGQSPLAFADSWARTEVDRAILALNSANLPADVAQQTERMIQDLGNKLVELYPAMSILTVAGMLLVMVLFLNRKAGQLLPSQSPFHAWKVAEHIVWILIVSGAAVLFLNGAWQRLAMNVVVVVLAIYFLQGLAILSYFLNVKGVPPVFRVLGYFLVVASFPLRVLATGVGIFDLWIDFRKPRNHKD